MELKALELRSPKKTSRKAYESFFPIDSTLLTCAKFPIEFTAPCFAKSAALRLVILLTPGMVPRLLSEETLEKCGHEFKVGTLTKRPLDGVFIGC